ncbi:MAG: SlyX protein, partial [Oceanospirillaceae bacterium]
KILFACCFSRKSKCSEYFEVQMEDRITELESRVAFQEQLIDQLNDVVAKQDKMLIGLSRVVEMLHQKVNQSESSEGQFESVDVPPPHY